MNQFLSQNGGDFSSRKVSVDQAMRLLGRNGIHVTREKAETIKAETILDFLYLIAKTYRTQKEHESCVEFDLKNESNTEQGPFY